jgi:hypothetical protein
MIFHIRLLVVEIYVLRDGDKSDEQGSRAAQKFVAFSIYGVCQA